MTDESDLKAEYLNFILAENEAVKLMVRAANLILEGGPKGIVDVVNEDDGPETILAAISGMVSVIDTMQDQINELVQEKMRHLDFVSETADTLTKITESLQ